MTDLLANLQRLGHRASISPSISQAPAQAPTFFPPQTPSYSLPLYIKPLPSKLGLDDILYLEKKGALAIPPTQIRDELLRSYAEFVHPYMPLLDIHELVATIDSDDGAAPISLLLFQAIMFSATAYVDLRHLRRAGYHSRRDARREFFQKTRLLYDFDIEVDRISLIQSLLLMTYWYETPDDQKDSHHWMGIVVSLSNTIGLHRNTEKSTAMDDARKKLWKRIWWSTYMRDRLIALGMRRPVRIKDADFDVPMLNIDDFEDAILPDGPSCIPDNCRVLRDAKIQRQLAIMCMEKVKLCICMSHVLSVQYSVLSNNHGVLSEEGSTITTVRLAAKKRDPEISEVQSCDRELTEWKNGLPGDAQYGDSSWQEFEAGGNASVMLNRALLFMIYYATLSALHRPQVLPSNAAQSRAVQTDMLNHSRKTVRLAATEITRIANTIYTSDLTRYLPTTGITVLIPAIIIHLLDIKAPDEATRRASLQGFCQCMQVLGKLRDIYAAADYSAAFLEAAIRKADISLPSACLPSGGLPSKGGDNEDLKQSSSRNVITSTQGLVDAGRRIGLLGLASPHARPNPGALTPPPDDSGSASSFRLQRMPSSSSSSTFYSQNQHKIHPNESSPWFITDAAFARTLNTFLASTPPTDSDFQNPLSDDSHLSARQRHGFDPMISAQTHQHVSGYSQHRGYQNHHHHHPLLPRPPHMTTTTTMATPTTTATADASYITIPQNGLNDFDSNDNDSDMLDADLRGHDNQASGDDDSDFDSFINLDAAGEVLSLDEGAFAAMSGESGGFTMDMDWLKGMKEDGGLEEAGAELVTIEEVTGGEMEASA
jgi:hypothetical protein